MARRIHTSEQIIHKLREAEVLLAQGQSVQQAARQIEVTEQTYYRWRNEYNHKRAHSALGYRPPVPEAVLPPNTVTRPMKNTTMNISMN